MAPVQRERGFADSGSTGDDNEPSRGGPAQRVQPDQVGGPAAEPAGRRRQLTRHRGDVVVHWRRVEFGVGAKHPLVQLLQRRRRRDAELLIEALPQAPVRLERLDLAAVTVERQHQQADRALAQRVFADEV